MKKYYLATFLVQRPRSSPWYCMIAIDVEPMKYILDQFDDQENLEPDKQESIVLINSIEITESQFNKYDDQDQTIYLTN